MRKTLLALGAAIVSTPLAAATLLNAPADVAAIKAFELNNARLLDADVLAESYAPDAVVLDYMVGGIHQGRDSIRKAMGEQLSGIKSSNVTITEHNIVTDGNFACDMQTTDYDVTKSDGSKAKLSLRQMDVLRKIDGKWQILQQQVGAMFDPKTQAVLLNGLQVRGDKVWPAGFSSEAVPEAQAMKEIKTWTDVSLRVVGIKKILPYYGPKEQEIVMYGPTTPGNVRGMTEFYNYYAPSMNSFASLETKNPILRVDTNGVLGAQTDIQDITLQLKNGKTQKLYWRQTDCVRRTGGKWYGVLNMSSFTLDPKTGKSDSKWNDYPAEVKAGNQS